MAIDVIPQPGPELKGIFKKKSRYQEARWRYIEKHRELKFLTEELPKGPEIRVLRAHVAALKEVLERRQHEWEEAEKGLCYNCEGKQFIDHSASGQMARTCSICEGTGTKKGAEARNQRQLERLRPYFDELIKTSRRRRVNRRRKSSKKTIHRPRG